MDKGAHGGPGRGQGDKKKCHKDVADESQFPRLESFFSTVRVAKAADGGQEGGTKRPRIESSDVDSAATDAELRAQSSDVDSATAGEASAAKSYLLGGDGIISEALRVLKSGDVCFTLDWGLCTKMSVIVPFVQGWKLYSRPRLNAFRLQCTQKLAT